MANKKLSEAAYVPSMVRNNAVMIEVGGSMRRIKLSDLINTINNGDEKVLSQVAWSIPLRQSEQSSTDWGRGGNLAMWEEYKRNCGRYLVTNNGLAAKLSATNSSVYADGTPLDESKGHIMVVPQRLYYLVKNESTGAPRLYLSSLPIGGRYIEGVPISAYQGSFVGTALVSRSGLAPGGGKSITEFHKAAQVNGADWGLVNYDHVRLLTMWVLSEYGNTNVQAKLGNGVCGDGGWKDVLWAEAAKLKTGATKSLGDNFGKIAIPPLVNGSAATTNSSRVSIMGIEDWYGWSHQMVQGIYFGSADNAAQDGTEVFIYEGNRMPTSAELTTHPAGDYRQLTRPATGGYIKEETLGEYFDMIPKTLGGSTTGYWCDYYSFKSTGQLCLWGGPTNPGASCGCACLASNFAFSSAPAYFGSRLAYFGKLKFVNGKEIV